MSVIPAAESLPIASGRPYLSEQERYYFASQWQLIWWRLRRHRFAMISLWFLLALYATIPFVEFLAPYELRSRHPEYVYSPPQRVRLFHEGRFVGPFVYGRFLTVNMETLKREYRDDPTRLYRLQFLAAGEPYRILLLPDHATPCALKTHTSDPVPYLLYDSTGDRSGGVVEYTEAATALSASVPAHELMARLVSSG